MDLFYNDENAEENDIALSNALHEEPLPEETVIQKVRVENALYLNFQNDISVEDISAFCGLNRSYFGKIFHDTIGRSPQEFLISYRMTKAAELLKITSLSIADIGNAVGYPNQLHFSRAFKNVYGMSPRNWRNENKLDESQNVLTIFVFIRNFIHNYIDLQNCFCRNFCLGKNSVKTPFLVIRKRLNMMHPAILSTLLFIQKLNCKTKL